MASTSKKIIVKSSDGETFEVDEAVALKLQPIKCMIEDDCADGEIPIPIVTGKILAKVLEYCNNHVDGKYGEPTTEFEEWEADFVKVDQTTLFDLISAANFLEIKSLLDLTCKTVANMMKGKSPVEIRKTFNIKNDFTPEEEEKIRRENAWAFN